MTAVHDVGTERMYSMQHMQAFGRGTSGGSGWMVPLRMRGNILAMRPGLVPPSSLLARNLSQGCHRYRCCVVQSPPASPLQQRNSLHRGRYGGRAAHHLACAAASHHAGADSQGGSRESVQGGVHCPQLYTHHSPLARDGESWQVLPVATAQQGGSHSRVVARRHGVKHYAAGPDVDLPAAVLEAAEDLRHAHIGASVTAVSMRCTRNRGRGCGGCNVAGMLPGHESQLTSGAMYLQQPDI